MALVVLCSESHPSHGRHEKSRENFKKRLQEAGLVNLTIHHEKVGQKRFIGGIMAAFTLFNNLADFKGRVNNVVGWFDNIDRFMGSGGTQSESQINVEQINELKTRLADLATDVENGFKSLLAGGEYTDVLNILAGDVRILQLIDGYQKEYLEQVKRYKERPAGERNSDEMAANEKGWFETIEARDDSLEDALGSLRWQVCGKRLLAQTSLYEAYAWKHGQQSTAEGSVESLMEFISRVRLLEANGYAVRTNFVMKKYKDNTARKYTELTKINTRMEQTKTCEDSAIARAMSRMVDHQGIPIFGRIRWSHSHHNESSGETYDRCLTYETGEATPEARSCSSNAQNQQWKLNADNTLQPRNEENKCLFLIEPEEISHHYGYKVLPCDASYNNKRFTFEYLSHQISGENKLHTFFKLKAKNDNFDREGWQGQDICLAFGASGGFVGTAFKRWVPLPFRCTCPPIMNELHSCIGNDPPRPSDNEYPWFKFEPVE